MEQYQQQQQWGPRGRFAGRAHGGDGGVKTGPREIVTIGVKALATMDITAKVTVVMEGMTKLLPTIATAMGIIATSRMVMGKYPGEVVIKIATNQNYSICYLPPTGGEAVFSNLKIHLKVAPAIC